MTTKITTPPTIPGLAEYVQLVQARLEEFYAGSPTAKPGVIVTYGPRFAKLIVTSYDSRRSVHSFVNRENGDIMKAEGWTRPALHARGNINNQDHGASALNGHSVRYL